MIFDSQEMQILKENSKGLTDALVSDIVFLGRSERMAVERDYLENLITLAPKSKQTDWLHRLLKEEADQHRGAWFEMMLYGWLSDLGQVDVEPQIEGNFPDFSLIVEGQKIVVEAKACVTDKTWRKRDSLNSELLHMLTQINKPFIISIEESTIETSPNSIDFRNEVTNWLDHSPDKPFLFRDSKGNEIRLEADRDDSLENVHCIEPINVDRLDPELLKDPLHKKAGQHRAIQKANYPYVIAILLDSTRLFIEQVISAWFGKEQWILDPNCKKIVESRIDQSGLHFRESEI